jgi:DNA helicase-2/ATP-dependent DNA helicase PcrA
MDFPEIFPDTEIITLEQNYRSIQPILDFTNRIIANAEEKYSKELFTDKEGGNRPVFVAAGDEDAQAEFVCKTILSLREDDVPLSDIAVLFRNSFHSNSLEVELTNRNIPYVKYGGFKFLEAAHIKDVMCFLKTVLNVDDEIGWRRVLPLIPGVGDVTAQNITGRISEVRDYKGLVHADFRGKKYEKDLRGLHRVYSEIISSESPVSGMIESFIPFYKPLLKAKYDNYNVRFQDINTLISMAGNYASLENFLTQLALEPPEKNVVEQADRDEEKLVLSTIHSAKGLEWNTVIILSLLEGYLPDKRCLDDKDEIEEERRLFYVGATRAKERLYLLRPASVHGGFSNYGNQGFTGILKSSRFLTEIEDIADLVEYQEYEREDAGYSDPDEGYEHDGNEGSGDTMGRINRYYD